MNSEEIALDRHTELYRNDPSYRMGFDTAKAWGTKWEVLGPQPFDSTKDEHLFYRNIVSGQMLMYANLPVIDFNARGCLMDWFRDHGYPDKELEQRLVEVTYRVKPKAGD